MDDLALPNNVDDLVKLLNETFPEKSPELKDDTKTIYFKAGQRDVVNFINNLKKEFTLKIEEVEIIKENVIFKIPGKLN